jgi:hypothetical protein
MFYWTLILLEIVYGHTVTSADKALNQLLDITIQQKELAHGWTIVELEKNT